VPLREVVDAACTRARAEADEAGVALVVRVTADAEVFARSANLAGLVLANLIANAIEASSRGGCVTLEARTADSGTAEFLVSDAGPGVPAGVREHLFRPVRSSKHGGGGVGLAISLRLAKHAGGDLQLVRSGPDGSVFRLVVPAAGAG
jgi:signal transduction histidine kinase